MAKEKKPSRQQVYTLVVQIGRKAGDGLPKGATGAGLVIYASGIDEAEAARWMNVSPKGTRSATKNGNSCNGLWMKTLLS